MATITVTNLTDDTVLLQELYISIKPHGVSVFNREIDQLHAMPRFQQLWHSGIIQIDISEDSAESSFINQKLHGINGITATTNAVRAFHQPIISATAGSTSPGQQPTLIAVGTVLTVAYTLNSDKGYRLFKIPNSFVDTPAFHVHWTKSSDVNESTKSVRWRLKYLVFPGSAFDITSSPSTIDIDDTYDDSGTTSRIVYRTVDTAATGFVGGYYVGVSVEAVTPAGVAMASKPALISVDMTFNEYINQ